MTELEAKAEEVNRRLKQAYGNPEWRPTLPPLDELISTILSQNTNDTNRDRAFDSLKQKYPTWEQVRDAPSASVIDAIRIAGLANQKGPRIQGALHQITKEQGDLDLSFLDKMESAEASEWLQDIPGVGPKTAAIVLLFSLGKPAFPVDTHVHRVTGRLGLRPDKMSAEKNHKHMEELYPPEAYYELHLNLIRHGRDVCVARTPACNHCMMMDLCSYYAGLPIEMRFDIDPS